MNEELISLLEEKAQISAKIINLQHEIQDLAVQRKSIDRKIAML